MAQEPQRKIGQIDCLCCGETMPVRQNGRDTLNVSCQWCGFSAYAKVGTEAHVRISSMIRRDEAASTHVETPTAPSAAAAAVKKLAKAFDLSEV